MKLEAYGRPTVELSEFRLWVHGRQYPEMMDCWDGNWLRITAHIAQAGASVVVAGPLLDTVSFLRFARELRALYEQLEGTAVLESHEPELKVTLRARGQVGQIEAEVEITPDHLNQEHLFRFSLDQTFLPPVIAQCERVLAEHPVRGASERGA